MDDEQLRERAADIRMRLRKDMRKTLEAYGLEWPELVHALAEDAMHQVELLLTEQPREE